MIKHDKRTAAFLDFNPKSAIPKSPTYPPTATLPYTKYSWYVPIMIDVLPSRLPSSPRRSGGSVTPFFQTGQAKRIYRFSVNFLRFARFFEEGVPLEKIPLSRSFFFAASPKAKFILSACKAVEGRLRVNHLHPQGARRGLIDLTRRREDAKGKKICV